MMSRLFNNLGICSVAIAFTTEEFATPLPLSKAVLIVPFISNRKLLNHLARRNIQVKNIEKLLINHTDSFANFNTRYYDTFADSINSIQFLLDIDVLTLNEHGLSLLKPISISAEMGRRAQKVKNASRNLASLLTLPAVHLYSSLRVQL